MASIAAFLCRAPMRFQKTTMFNDPEMTAARTDGTSMAPAAPFMVTVVMTIHIKAAAEGAIVVERAKKNIEQPQA